MTRFALSTLLVLALGTILALPASAAEPQVSKRVLADAGGTSVVLLNVTASGRDIYGISISDASGSIEDIVSPNGWAGVTSGDRVVFRTSDTPIGSGKTVTFRIVTKNKDAGLTLLFRDSKSVFSQSSL